MTNISNKASVVLEKIELSREESHHIYNELPLYKKRFDLVMSFHPPGVAAVKDESGAYHINIEGMALYEKRFLKTFGFYDGNAAVVDESGWYHIDINSNPIYNERHEWVGNFQEGKCPVRDKNGDYFHIKKDGTQAYDKKYNYVGDFKYGIAVVYSGDGSAWHIDKSGKLLHDNKFIELGVFHKGYATAKDNRGAFHINKNGAQLYKERYGWVEPFYNGFALACKQNGEKLIINQKGALVHQIYDQKSSNIQYFLRSHLMGMLVGYWKTQIIRSFVELEILDIIKTGKNTFDNILKASQLPAPSLKMIIQALKIWNFIEERDNLYKLKYLGDLLTEDHPKSLKYAALMWGGEHYQTMAKLTDALKDYKPQFQEIFGQSIFDYFNAYEEKGEIFNKAMKAYSLDYDNLIKAYDFSSTKVIMDVGGGTGRLLIKILNQNDYIEKGILLEMPAVIENAQRLIENKPIYIKERFKFISGDFFEEILSNADTIIMSRVLHDWNDFYAVKILKNIHNALEKDGKLLIFEMIVPENLEYDIGVTLNFNLLVNVGGKERTYQEFESILRKTGFKINSIKSNKGIISMIIAEKINKKQKMELINN